MERKGSQTLTPDLPSTYTHCFKDKGRAEGLDKGTASNPKALQTTATPPSTPESTALPTSLAATTSHPNTAGCHRVLSRVQLRVCF